MSHIYRVDSPCPDTNRAETTAVARIVRLQRRPGTRHDGLAAVLIDIATEFSRVDPTAAHPAAAFEREVALRGHKVSGGYVGRLLRGPLSWPAAGEPESRLVEVSRGRYRLRTEADATEDAVSALAAVEVARSRASAARVHPGGCRAAVLTVGAELAAADPAGLIRAADLCRLLPERGFPFTRHSIRKTLMKMAGHSTGASRATNDLERVRRGVYRLVPSRGVDRPAPAPGWDCRRDVVEAVRRLSEDDAGRRVHVTEIRAALPAYSVSGIRTALSKLVASQPGVEQILERAGRGWYRLRD